MTKKQIKQAHEMVSEKVVTPFVDLILGKTMSKKLMVFFMATAGIMMQHLSSEEWLRIAEIYIGSQAVVDVAGTFVGKYRNNYKNNLNSEDDQPK